MKWLFAAAALLGLSLVFAWSTLGVVEAEEQQIQPRSAKPTEEVAPIEREGLDAPAREVVHEAPVAAESEDTAPITPATPPVTSPKLSDAEIEALLESFSVLYEGATRDVLESERRRLMRQIPKDLYYSLHQAKFDAEEYELVRPASSDGERGFHMDAEYLEGNLPVLTQTYMQPSGLVARTHLEPHEVTGFEEDVHQVVWIVKKLRTTR